MRVLSALLCALFVATLVSAQEKKETEKKKDPAKAPAVKGKDLVAEAAATPVERIKTLKDFKVELLYSVPKETEGSWVSMCLDPKGRLIVSDQGGGLYRVTLPKLGEQGVKVEKIPANIGEAQGLLWAFDSLYVMVNGRKFESGLYRVKDTDGDDMPDQVTQLRKLNGGGEHGPHAIVAHPDGKSLVVVHGNQTKLTDRAKSRVPATWGEDHLLPRMPDGRGFMAGVLGPGGALYKIDPEGKEWELLCVGFRNQYDAAFNAEGDLFTFDADMEYDFNTPWYRPTRVNLVASGGDYGWRNGAGKYPAYYVDSLPTTVDIGPGSPTGVTFGTGAKFPAKYQRAFFICDWSYGKLYAVHLKPQGSGYTGEFEEFISGSPLPLTDLLIHPDGAMYFAIGGRNTQSGLYRVTYTGKESTAPATEVPSTPEREARLKLEAFHGVKDPAAIAAAWPALASEDRFLRGAARVALEHQDPAGWREKALNEANPTAAIPALLALVHVSAPCPAHRKPSDPPVDAALSKQIAEALSKIDWSKLNGKQQADLARVWQIYLNRFGTPADAEREKILAALNPVFPLRDRFANAELLPVLVYLQAPDVAGRGVKLLASAPTQEEQIDYARALRMLKTGWTPEQRKEYFQWFLKASTFKGGSSFDNFMANIKRDAVATLTPSELAELKPILEAAPAQASATVSKPRPFVKKWTLDEVLPLVNQGLKERDFDRGRSMFAAANCFACHRFAGEGGANGPDLSGAAGRFSVRDLLESIVDPSKTISDQYQAVVITTTEGKTVTGRIVNLSNDNMMINTDMLNPGGSTSIKRSTVESMEPSKLSMMPTSLLDTLNQDELLDLLAFLLSRGDRKSGMFRGE